MESFRESIKVIIKPKQEDSKSDENLKDRYSKLIEGKREQFLIFINYLNRYINELKEDNVIYPSLICRARIKTSKSAIENYGKKAVDDIFGIEFICATDEEIKILQQEIKQILSINKEKKVHKKNGYEAVHCSYGMKEELIEELNGILVQNGKEGRDSEMFPNIEIQYKTIEVDYTANFGTASHEKYKNTEIMQIQKMYDEGKLVLGDDIPYMWISDENSDTMKELEIEEILKKMYPSLKVKGKEKTLGKNNQGNEENVEYARQ